MAHDILSDLLIETSLENAKERFFEGTYADFAAVFGATISPAVSQLVWNQLQFWGRDGFRVEAAFSPVVYKDSHVIISVVCENCEPNVPLGYAISPTVTAVSPTVRELEASSVQVETMGVYIMAPNRDVLRLLDLFVKSALIFDQDWFLEKGINRPVWVRTSDLAPVEVARGNETVLKYVRKQTWTVDSVFALRPFGGQIVSPKQILVHRSGTFVNAVPNPETRTYEELNGTTAGGVTPMPED
jgi:hypothetical protein